MHRMSNLLCKDWKLDTTFTFFAGSLLVLCGPSGVGKSTLVKRLLSSLAEKPLLNAVYTFKGVGVCVCACVMFVGSISFTNFGLQTKDVMSFTLT